MSISSPANGATVSGTIDVNATASDNVGVAGVQFKLDGANLGAEDTASPYTQAWSTNGVANGSHALTAVARDASGNTKTSTTVTVTVNNTATTGLVGAYGFEETSGTTAVDSSGSGNPGTINGPVSTTAGKFGRALSFDGVNDLVTDRRLQRARPDHGHDPRGVGAAQRSSPAGAPRCSRSRPTGWCTRSTRTPTRTARAATSSPTPSSTPAAPPSWPRTPGRHLAATYDGATLKLYVNGTLASSKAVTGSLFNSTGALRIGGNNVWPEWFAGLIDEVRVYKRALTATEVTADMNRAVLP